MPKCFECDSCGKVVKDKRKIHILDYSSPLALELDDRGKGAEVYMCEGFEYLIATHKETKCRKDVLEKRFYICSDCTTNMMQHYLHHNDSLEFKCVTHS